MKDIIEWHQAQELPQKRQEEQQKYIADFLEEDCEMANGRDLHFWMEKTGKDIFWILNNGRNIHPVLKEAAILDKSFDTVWDFDPILYENEQDLYDEDDIWDGEWNNEYPSSEMINIFKNTLNH